MNQFGTLLIIVLVPGIIATVIFGKLTRHDKWDYFTFSFHAILFGWFSYLPLYLIPASIAEFEIIKIPLTKLGDINKSIYWEVLCACFISVPLAFSFAYSANYNLLNRFARFIKCSHKYGDESLYSYYLSNENIDWIYVRHREENRIYRGKIVNYRQMEKLHELLLIDADIYNYADSAWLYHAEEIYINAETGKFTIELAKDSPGKNNAGLKKSHYAKNRAGTQQKMFPLPPRNKEQIASLPPAEK